MLGLTCVHTYILVGGQVTTALVHCSPLLSWIYSGSKGDSYLFPIFGVSFLLQPYAYSSAPIILKNAVSHWPATSQLNYTFLKDLYLRTPGALESVQEDCQFLHFKSNFMNLNQVFEMSDDRAHMKPGEQPWYIGWSNCHPTILTELRKLYPRPHFLPSDAEMPNTDFVFLGWEQGAVMHVS